MLLETKIRTEERSIISSGHVIDTSSIESTSNVSLANKRKNVWAELIWKVEAKKDNMKTVKTKISLQN